MKLKHKISGYIIRSAACAVLLSCAIVGFSSAFNSPGNDSKLRRRSQSSLRGSGQTKTLTFADRVSYQRAIEEIYWHHRIWPNERRDRKPSLDAVMSQAQIEKKVEDYLRDSQALEDYWQRPITPEQLQAEMERIAHHTKQPQVLREIFQALGDDPLVIAECLARQGLAQRLVKGLNTHDRDQVRQAAFATAVTNANYALPLISGQSDNWTPSGLCTEDTWTATSITGAATGRNLHTAVWTGSEMIVWGGGTGGGNLFNTGGKYNPSTDSWTATSTTNAPPARAAHTAVWTGSEMIVWGGLAGPTYFNTGGRYNPSTDSWSATSTTNASDARANHTAVWTGSEMIVWGGDAGATPFNTGGRYDPSTDSWTATSTTSAPDGRHYHTAVWTDSEMIVWGGYGPPSGYLNTGGRYNPGTDSWTATSTSNAPDARESHTAVLTGSEMIVWGGYGPPSGYLNTGGRYNPGTDSWTATSTTGAPTARLFHTAVSTGGEMIVWGGASSNPFMYLNTGGRYNSSTDNWTATSTTNAPSARIDHTAVWTGSEMIVWGGEANNSYFNTGGRYCAATTGTPTPTPTSTPTATATPTATSTPTATPRITPTPRSRPTPAPRP